MTSICAFAIKWMYFKMQYFVSDAVFFPPSVAITVWSRTLSRPHLYSMCYRSLTHWLSPAVCTKYQASMLLLQQMIYFSCRHGGVHTGEGLFVLDVWVKEYAAFFLNSIKKTLKNPTFITQISVGYNVWETRQLSTKHRSKLWLFAHCVCLSFLPR